MKKKSSPARKRTGRRSDGPYAVLGGVRVRIAITGPGIDGEKILTRVLEERNHDRR